MTQSLVPTPTGLGDVLNAALAEGARRSDGRVMACFNPRHGLRLIDARGVVTDVVICFECRQVQVIRDGRQVAAFPTDASPQAAFDEVLTHASVRLAPKELMRARANPSPSLLLPVLREKAGMRVLRR